MNIAYYSLPLQLFGVLEGNELETVDLKASIANNLELIIMTRFGEHRYDASFGCEIWDLDFELIVNATKWEEKLRQSLLRSITTHELRLADVALSVQISEVEKLNPFTKFSGIKKRVFINISGAMHKTGEPFTFSNSLLLSPLSID